jgi:glycerol-3-phosphate dehydrogenase (NAD(P)+)
VTDRIWPNVMLQWEWLGGLPPLRRAAVIGAGAWGTTVAVMLARAGLEVDLGTLRDADDRLPAIELPDRVSVLRAGELELSRHDLVCFATSAAALPAAVAEHGANLPHRAGVLVLSKGMVPPLGTLPAAYVAERTASWAVGALGGPADPVAALEGGASLVFAATDAAFRRQVADALVAAGFDATATPDVVGVELAGCAAEAAAHAVAATAAAGPNAAGSAAGKVFAEVEEYARSTGATPGTFAGVAGAGDLVATILAGDRHPAMPAAVPLLADRVMAAGVDAPVLRGLANVIEGKVAPERWTASLTAPRPTASRRENVKVA